MAPRKAIVPEVFSERYLEDISRDWLWREKELREVDDRLLQKQLTFEMKSSILLVYSHWEGLFKFGSTTVLEFICESINRKFFAWTDIRPEVRYRIIFCQFRRSSAAGQTQETFIGYLNSLNDDRYSNALQAKDEIIMIDDNLSSMRAEAICRNLGMDYGWCSLKKVIIDERILAYRNAIAHGSTRLRSGDIIDLLDPDILDAIIEMRSIIREARHRFQNTITRCDFLQK